MKKQIVPETDIQRESIEYRHGYQTAYETRGTFARIAGISIEQSFSPKYEMVPRVWGKKQPLVRTQPRPCFKPSFPREEVRMEGERRLAYHAMVHF